MHTGKIVFSQVMDLLPLRRFRTCVDRYRGDFKVQSFTCQDHFRVLAFAQLSHRESLRDIEICLRAMRSKLYHMGIRSPVSKNTLSNASEVRDWRICADFAQVLITHARQLYADEGFTEEMDALTLYALDASIIDICLSLFPWARFRRTKAAVKLHALIDLRDNISTFYPYIRRQVMLAVASTEMKKSSARELLPHPIHNPHHHHRPHRHALHPKNLPRPVALIEYDHRLAIPRPHGINGNDMPTGGFAGRVELVQHQQRAPLHIRMVDRRSDAAGDSCIDHRFASAGSICTSWTIPTTA
jgi:hypothetical protein